VPLTLVAGLGHWWLGTVDVVLLVSLLIGSLPGIALRRPFRRQGAGSARGLLRGCKLIRFGIAH
jgi:hypothetical protein